MTTNGHFSTKSLRLGATLQAVGFPLDSWEWRGRECFFTFRDRDGQLGETVRAFYARELRLDPVAIFDAVDGLREILKARA
jgi:hypothetical protein